MVPSSVSSQHLKNCFCSNIDSSICNDNNNDNYKNDNNKNDNDNDNNNNDDDDDGGERSGFSGSSSDGRGSSGIRTRPDTRPIPVANVWAGAKMRLFTLSNSITTDQWTNGRTDKASYRVACPQQKIDSDKTGYTAIQSQTVGPEQ